MCAGIVIVPIYSFIFACKNNQNMTETYRATDPISDLISDDYRMLQVMSRFGLSLGFGDQTVAAACKACNVDAGTFLAVVNFIKSGDHVRLGKLVEDVNVQSLMQYLKRSHSYFIDFRLPSIRRKLIEAIDCTNNQIAFLILKFYDEYAAEVGRHMEYENTHVHPYVDTLIEGRLPNTEESFSDLIHQHHDNHGSIEKSSSELKNIIIKYYPSDSNAQLLNEVLMDIYMMEEDLLSHCHLEDQLFAECVVNLENDVKSNACSFAETIASEAESNSAADILSEREKEIVVEVVKGFSNKEIADHLFISLNTVTTHRRNISRKLNIHSSAGLTIYAIVNGLVNLEDVNV